MSRADLSLRNTPRPASRSAGLRSCGFTLRGMATGRSRSGVAARIGLRWPQKVRLISARANKPASLASPPADSMVSRSSAQASVARSTTSSPALQYQPAICMAGSSKGRAKPRQRRAAHGAETSGRLGPACARGRDGEIDQRHGAEFAVERAGRLDVIGDGEGEDARGDLAWRVDEAFALGAGPVDFDHDIGAAAGWRRRSSARPCGRRRRSGAGWRSRRRSAASSGICSSKAGCGRSTLIHSGCGAGSTAADTAGARKKLAAAMARMPSPPI